MPTSRPRMTLTLTPEIDRALTDFSRLTGQSKSSFICEVLAEAVPQLQRMAVVIQQANKLQGDAFEAARSRLVTYAEAVTQQSASTLRNVDLFLDAAAPQADTASSKRAAASVLAASAAGPAFDVRPPLSNRGGRPRSTDGKVVKIGRAKRDA